MIVEHWLQHYLVNYMAGAALETRLVKEDARARYYHINASGGDYILVWGDGKKPPYPEMKRLDNSLPQFLDNKPAHIFALPRGADIHDIIPKL